MSGPINPTPPTETKNPFKAISWNFNPEQARRVAAVVAQIAGAVLIVLAFATAIYATYSLGQLFNVGPGLSALVAAISVLALVVHGVSVASAPNNAGRLVNAIFFGMWALALLVITAAYFWLIATGSVGKDGAILFTKLEKMGGDSNIVDMGQSIYAFCAALPLLTALLGIIVPRVSASPLNDLLHKSMGHAWSGWALNIASIAAAGYGAMHILTFGQIVGMSGFAPVFAAVVLDVAFLGAKARLTSLFKIRKITHPWQDGEFVALCVLCGLIGVYALACNLGVTRLEPLTPPARLALMNSDKVIRLTVDAYGVLSPVVLLAMLVYSVAVLLSQSKDEAKNTPTHPTQRPGRKAYAKDEPTGTPSKPEDERLKKFKDRMGKPDADVVECKCEVCDTAFNARVGSRFCSAKCRQKSYRHKKKLNA